MAKRKSTKTSSSGEAEDKVESSDVAETSPASDAQPSEQETVSEALDAVEAYAPKDKTDGSDTGEGDQSDDVIELAEPGSAPAKADGAAVDNSATDEVVVKETHETEVSEDTISQEQAEQLLEEAETPSSEDHTPDGTHLPVAPQIVRETVVERKGGFVPMLLGGAAAAVLGYGVAAYVSQDLWPFAGNAQDDPFAAEVREALTAQDGTMSGLSDRLATLEGVEPPVFDLTPLEARIAEMQDTASGLNARLDDIVTRIDTLERQPMEQAVSPEAIAAYERALADLQAEVEAQRAEVEQIAQEAVQAETNASEQAQLAGARSAMAEVTASLETGSGYADALTVLSENGFDVPQGLSAAADSGVATQSQLIEAFPDAARAALSEVRSSETQTADGANRVATFFANQLGARSVAPRDGDDADAILSRSEAALRSGDLSTAISELDGLPEAAQGAVADWRARAETRLEAKTAADALVQQLLQN